ncbi:MAG: hypothetical protein NW226_22215 [Microscillaceae bacterium]|nr:hypothetical protein [Microscillaceae bacterium]
MNQYMIEIELPRIFDEEFLATVPKQVEQVSLFIAQSKINSYSLSLSQSKLWTTITADSEMEVLEILASLPLYKWMTFKIHNLMFNYQTKPTIFPPISLN